MFTLVYQSGLPQQVGIYDDSVIGRCMRPSSMKLDGKEGKEQRDTRHHKRHILDDRENESQSERVRLLRGTAADASYERTLPGSYIHLVPDTIKLTKGSIVCCGHRTRPTRRRDLYLR
ncbi:unnamed protein product [Lasius platythorax]|uniref:Uncharacterized protein n=1 Tax=Lasius platythorax TaxID=488582 RepID=A0AAV2NM70_9HYME